MHCRNCGKPVHELAVVCVACGTPPLAGNNFCQHCGAETSPAATVCIQCGLALKGGAAARSNAGAGDRIAASDPPKDPVLMAVLSGCCIAWLGQIILGQTTKGIVLLLGTVLIAVFTCGYGVLLYPVIWIVAAVDAYLIAKKLKEGKTVGQWEFF